MIVESAVENQAVVLPELGVLELDKPLAEYLSGFHVIERQPERRASEPHGLHPGRLLGLVTLRVLDGTGAIGTATLAVTLTGVAEASAPLSGARTGWLTRYPLVSACW